MPKVPKVTRQSDKPEKTRDCVIVLNCSGEQLVWLFVEFQVLKGLKASAQCCIPAEPVPRGCRCTMQKSWLEAWHIVYSTRPEIKSEKPMKTLQELRTVSEQLHISEQMITASFFFGFLKDSMATSCSFTWVLQGKPTP